MIETFTIRKQGFSMLVEKTGLSVLKTDFGVSLACCGNEGIYNIKAN